MKGIVVSAITNNYSNPRSVVKYNPNWEYIMFVDSEEMKAQIPFPWQPVVFPGLQDRGPKLLTHKFLSNWDKMIWVDGSVTLTEDPDLIIQTMGESDMLARRHTRCSNVFEDLNKCILLNKCNPDVAVKVFGEYSQLGSISTKNYLELGFFARVNSPEVNQMFDDWAEEYHRLGIGRDQPAFARIARGSIKVIDPYKRKFIQVGYHTSKRLESRPVKPVVHYVTLLSDTKRVQPYLEETLNSVPDDHWICITDADSLFFGSDDGAFITEVIKQNPGTHLFGCMTNRQGLHWQVEEGHQFENADMTYHARTADMMKHKYKTYAPLINIPVAGQFMLMPKWVWKKFKFMDNLAERDENNKPIYFDWDFCTRLLEEGGKVRLIKGLYRFHLYRLLKGHSNITHLNV